MNNIQILKKCKAKGVIRPLILNCGYDRLREAIIKQFPDKRYIRSLGDLSATASSLSWIIDKGSGDDFRPVVQANVEERDIIFNELIELQQAIRSAVLVTEGASFVEEILKYPSEESIFYRRRPAEEQEYGLYELCITQWGYTDYNKPVITPKPVPKPMPGSKEYIRQLICSYSTGELLSNAEIYLRKGTYKLSPICLDEAGAYDLTQLKLRDGTELDVSLEEDFSQGYQTIVLSEDKQNYEIIFPLYTNAYVSLINQFGETVPNTYILVNNEQYKSNEDGLVFLENIDLGDTSELIVNHQEGTECSYALDLDPELNRFSYRIKPEVKVQALIHLRNQFDEAIPNYRLLVGEDEFFTNEDGLIYLENLTWTEGLELKVKDSQTVNQQAFLLSRHNEDNEFVFAIEQFFDCSCTFKLRYPDYKPVPSYSIQLEYDGNKEVFMTDIDGCHHIPSVQANKLYIFRDVNNAEIQVEFIPTRGEEEVLMIIDYPKVPLYHFRLLDASGEVIKGQVLDMQINRAKAITKTTEIDGHFAHPKEELAVGDKITCSFETKSLDEKKKGLQKYKLSCKIKKGQDEYILQYKPKSWRWLWLLLLLPFFALLFINYERDIKIKTVLDRDSSIACQDVSIKAHFVSHHLYKNGKWFVTDTLDLNADVDESGEVTFSDIGMSGYSHIFYMFSDLSLEAKSECMRSVDSIYQYKLHSTLPSKVFEIRMEEKRCHISVQVFDNEFQSPVPEATVSASFVRNNEHISQTMQTDVNGRAMLTDLPQCINIDSISIVRYGYDTLRIKDLAVKGILEQDPNIIANLKANKQRISFFVRNSQSKEPIPQALVTMTYKSAEPGQTVRVDSVITNVDGMGLGFFDGRRMNDQLTLRASCINFKDGTFGRPVVVSEFIALDSLGRTLFLDPEHLTIQVKEVDRKSGEPISGMMTSYTIDQAQYSCPTNRNGVFNVQGTTGRKVKVDIAGDDFYEALSTTIEIGRDSIIELSPKLLNIKISVVDIIDKTLIPNSQIVLSVNGDNLAPFQAFGDGTFLFQAYPNDDIVIEASAPDYNSNSFSSIKAKDLFQIKEDERVIPLGMPPCSDGTVSLGGGQNAIKSFFMGQRQGQFVLTYDTVGVPDEIRVYNASKKEVENNPSLKPIWVYPKGSTYGKKKATITFNNGPIITVKIIPSSSQSDANVSVDCPIQN